MADQKIKLVTWKSFLFITIVIFFSAAFSLFMFYDKKGYLETVDWVCAGAVIPVGMIILCLITRHANKPEK